MYKLEILPEFIQDRDYILSFIYSETEDINITKKLFNKIESKIFSLQIFPEMYPEVFEWYRMISLKTYKVFYKISYVKKTVYIIRFLSSAQNYQEYL